jgi:hypothetical protein
MDHGRACFLLLKHEAAVWTTYGGHGQLLGATVRAAAYAVVQEYKTTSPRFSACR